MVILHKFDQLEKNLKIKFKNKKLLEQAFVHRSYLNENPGCETEQNERLEFLGDAVMELVVTNYLFQKFPKNPEGDLTAWRAALVNSKMLSEVASRLGFNDYLILSKGESQDNGRARQFILANTLEATIGAIYLDCGYDKAEEFILKNIICELKRVLDEKLYVDPKSYFQEQAQGKVGITPYYKVRNEEGPDHCKKFIVGVYLNDELIAEGEGPSKQSAQEDAARKALKKRGWE
ncbi:MAG TPA: ribonuclease III [Candidatus Portnoybacteria bacterium]|jgi:ribonuclease III|nr:ribonuclease III [Candidatus Portnoybacteria bacterium]MDD5752018.1 ribonuclease III [Candidatus Portnoybacteria bacterium]HOZ16368.1 ribonuclease III [Candidatus Portnoybacteria bacterium]HPH52082.1 ribonuclease III [Candidatus Portnoybacteria bacterium]HPJ80231.1 ribonuclease III [Candidatus Portnoybacteria bacterium]